MQHNLLYKSISFIPQGKAAATPPVVCSFCPCLLQKEFFFFFFAPAIEYSPHEVLHQDV